MPKSGEPESIWRVGIGHDTHRLVEGRSLILGGIQIDHPKGLLGHSDADVVMHSVADALLGAAGIGDIGEHFPDNDSRWAGIAGSDLLGRVVAMLADLGFLVVNIDVTIHAQAPKLSLFKTQMANNLAQLLGIEDSRANVKAKTGEGVGPVGRGEIIGCDAIAMIRLNRSKNSQ